MINIVMAYFDRRVWLQRTLESIKLSKHHKDVKIIIVDDASEVPLTLESIDTLGLDIFIETITIEEKTWTNPCVAYNRGFRHVEGDMVIIQNPECVHSGDVIAHAINNYSETNYLVYSCWSLCLPIPLDFKNYESLPGRWYCHSTLGLEKAYHFLSVISKKNLKKLGGFDQRYADGYCFDDDEFLFRIKRMGLDVQIVPTDEVYCVHQHHSKKTIENRNVLWKRNCDLFNNVTKKELGYTANE